MVRNPQELLHDGENCAINKDQFISASLSVQQERLIEPTPYYFVRVTQPGYKRLKGFGFPRPRTKPNCQERLVQLPSFCFLNGASDHSRLAKFSANASLTLSFLDSRSRFKREAYPLKRSPLKLNPRTLLSQRRARAKLDPKSHQIIRYIYRKRLSKIAIYFFTFNEYSLCLRRKVEWMISPDSNICVFSNFK